MVGLVRERVQAPSTYTGYTPQPWLRATPGVGLPAASVSWLQSWQVNWARSSRVVGAVAYRAPKPAPHPADAAGHAGAGGRRQGPESVHQARGRVVCVSRHQHTSKAGPPGQAAAIAAGPVWPNESLTTPQWGPPLNTVLQLAPVLSDSCCASAALQTSDRASS